MTSPPEIEALEPPRRPEFGDLESSHRPPHRPPHSRRRPAVGRSPKIRALPAEIAAAAVVALLAASPPAAAQQYPTRVYTEQDGLPSSTVHDVMQDDTGFVWIATRAGLARYDGTEWKTWPNGKGLARGSFGEIGTGRSGRVWGVTDVNPFRLVVLEEGRWRALKPTLPKGPPRVVEAAVELLVGTRESRDEPILVTSRGRVVAWRSGAWHSLLPEGRSTDGRIAFCAALDGHSVLVGFGSGLLRVPVAGPPAAEPVPGLEGRAVTGLVRRSSAAGWWLAGPSWVGRWDSGQLRVVAEGADFCPRLAECGLTLAPDGAGGVWVASKTTVTHVLRDGDTHRVGVAEGLGSEGANGLLLDRQHNLWLAGQRALSKLRDGPVLGFDRRHGLLADEVSSVLQTRDGSIWLGHPGGLTRLVGDVPRETIRFDGDPHTNRVMALREDAGGTIWIALARGGLLRRSPAGDLSRVRLPVPPDRSAVAAVHVAEDGAVWAGGAFGLVRSDGEIFEPVPLLETDRDLPVTYVRRIVDAGPRGLLLPTIRDGVLRWDDGEVTRHRSPEGGHANSVYTAIADGDTLLVGGATGLFRLTGDGTLERAGPPAYPRIRRPVYLLAHDREGRLWIGTDYGVMRWDGQNRLQLTVHEGLPGNEANRDAGVADDRGRFWIGTNAGAAVFRERDAVRAPAPPRVHLAGMTLEGKPFPADGPAEVKAKTAGLSVAFDVLSFIDEERVRVASRLEGLEEGWRPPQRLARPELTYPRLEPGTYRLHLRAVAADGTAGPAAVTGPIRVAPPFWMSAWFWILAGTLLLGVVAFGGGLVAQWRAATRLEREVRRRTEELRASEQDLQREKELLSATLRSAAEGVIAVGADGRAVLSNPAADRLLDRREGLVGERLDAVFPEAEPPAGQDPALVRAILGGGSDVSVSGTLEVRLNGGKRLLEGSLAPIKTPGGEWHGAVIAFRDVTDRRRLEEELTRVHKLESLGILAGGIAHDFNNLLTVMIGNLSLMESQLDVHRDREALRASITDMTQAAIQAKELASQLLTFARGGEPRMQRLSVSSVAEQAKALALSGSGAMARLELDADLPRIEADPAQLTQVLQNLLINADQATGRGGRIDVRAKAVEPGAPGGLEDRPAVLVEVQDDGPGIPPETLERIFDPYFSTKPGGSGLGLAVAHSIVRRHGGRMTADSEPGRGARFRVALPAVEPGPEQAAGGAEDVQLEHPATVGSQASGEQPTATTAAAKPAPAAGLGEEEAAPPRGRVLVLEDEPAIRTLLERMLERLGCTVASCAEGRAAVDAYRDALESGERFELVIADLTIAGGMGGRETAAELLRLDPSARVAVASGYSSDPVLARPAEYGFCAALEKPYRLADLQRVLAEQLDGRT